MEQKIQPIIHKNTARTSIPIKTAVKCGKMTYFNPKDGFCAATKFYGYSKCKCANGAGCIRYVRGVSPIETIFWT